jgi:hypothetical protein
MPKVLPGSLNRKLVTSCVTASSKACATWNKQTKFYVVVYFFINTKPLFSYAKVWVKKWKLWKKTDSEIVLDYLISLKNLVSLWHFLNSNNLVDKTHEIGIDPSRLVEIVGLLQQFRQLLTTDISKNKMADRSCVIRLKTEIRKGASQNRILTSQKNTKRNK